MDSAQARQSVNNGLHLTDSRRASTNNRESTWLAPMESHNWLMHLHYTRGDTEKAKGLIFEQLEKSGGNNEFAHYLMGIIYSGEERLNEAIEEFRSCNRLSPTNIDYIKEIAKCLFKQKRYKLGLEALMEAENLSKKLDWEIHFWIAECLAALGNKEAALQWSGRAARAGGRLPACRQLGDLLAGAGDLPGAIQAYTTALESAPDNAELLTSLGILHVRAREQQMAVERLGSALALGPPQARALLPLAAIMQSHRDFDVALSRYKIAAQQTPDCPALWNNIGMCFFGKQKYVAAVSCLKRAACLSPLSARVLHNLGLVHAACSQHASAFHFLCAALNLRSGSAHTYLLMAVTLERLEDQDNALKAYEQATVLGPDDLLVRINYCVFLLSSQRPDQARFHLSVAEEIAGKMHVVDKECSEALDRLRALTASDAAVKDKPDSDSEPIYETIKENNLNMPAKDASAEETGEQEEFVDPDEV